MAKVLSPGHLPQFAAGLQRLHIVISLNRRLYVAHVLPNWNSRRSIWFKHTDAGHDLRKPQRRKHFKLIATTPFHQQIVRWTLQLANHFQFDEGEVKE